MQLYLLLGLVLVLSNKYKDIYVQAGVKLALLGLAATSIFLFDYTLVHTYTAIINWNEINYATGKMNIYNWMDYYYPRMATFTKWCEDPPEGKRTALAIFESEGFWLYHSYRDDYYFRSFATNCYVSTPPVPSDPDKVLAYLKDQKMKFWIASISSCVPPKSVVLIDPKESGVDLLQLKINNMIICNSTEVESHLYYFDYENVK
jgi:hypothetical protein